MWQFQTMSYRQHVLLLQTLRIHWFYLQYMEGSFEIQFTVQILLGITPLVQFFSGCICTQCSQEVGADAAQRDWLMARNTDSVGLCVTDVLYLWCDRQQYSHVQLLTSNKWLTSLKLTVWTMRWYHCTKTAKIFLVTLNGLPWDMWRS